MAIKINELYNRLIFASLATQSVALFPLDAIIDILNHSLYHIILAALFSLYAKI